MSTTKKGEKTAKTGEKWRYKEKIKKMHLAPPLFNKNSKFWDKINFY